jgi:3-phosphoshikimate 1-carboxyvinyltransferase
MKVNIAPPPRLEGEVAPPGDKSISHRALLLNAIARGKARLRNLGPGADVLSTVTCLRALGVRIELEGGEAVVRGIGLGLVEPQDVLQAGNSATTLRLLAGLLSAQPFLSVITGDASLRSRPMDRVIVPLRQMGAQIWGRGGDNLPPLAIRGGGLKGIQYRLPLPSAQVKSAVLLAGLLAKGGTEIVEPVPSRDHTERLLLRMGATIRKEGERISLEPLGSPLPTLDIDVPGDISSAAFFLAVGALHPQASLRLLGVGVNPTRTGFLEVMRSMGASLRMENQREEGGEPLADLEVKTCHLDGLEVGGEIIPRLIDELPVLAVVATQARGRTIIRGAGELRVKESDRIAITTRELNRMGAGIEELPDGFIIQGPTPLKGAEVDSCGDHRLAMALAVAALVARGETTILGAEAADVSYPGFFQTLQHLGKS